MSTSESAKVRPILDGFDLTFRSLLRMVTLSFGSISACLTERGLSSWLGEWKRQWYLKNGFVEGKTLFTSADGEDGSLDQNRLKETALNIKKLLK